MPRRPRCLIDNGYYHIVTRGNNRRELFRNEQDYIRFLEVSKKYLKVFQVRIFHYCLMPNHIHLLVQALIADNLPKFMKGILQTYAIYFRKEYDSVGFIFQNRYKSYFIDKESYLLECARYIEKNPIRAKIVDNHYKYRWSSFLLYAQGITDGIVESLNPCYMRLSNSSKRRQEKFLELVLEERPYDRIIDDFFRIRIE